jgi:hypothetical protein
LIIAPAENMHGREEELAFQRLWFEKERAINNVELLRESEDVKLCVGKPCGRAERVLSITY